MKRKKKLDIEELKDSQFVYLKDLPKFSYFMLGCIAFFVIGVAIWSVKTQKVSIIQTNGIVESDNKNYIMAPFSGEIVSNSMEEGMVVEKGDVLLKIKSLEFDLQKEQLINNKKVYEKQIEHLNKLILSIEDEKNYFHKENEDESLYYNQFEIYKSQIEQQRIDVNTFENIGYSEEQIEAQIIINQNKIAEIYYSTLASVEQTILQYKQQIEEINIQINSIDSGKTEYVITANASGILHLNDEYNLGMIIQASTVLGSISNELDEYHIEASVVAADYAKIENGEKVDIEVSGLPSSLYGSLSGKITRIDSDSTVIKDAAGNSIPTYRISIKPDGDFWVSAKGKKINLSSGMEVELYIQYDELTYFDYFLECIGVSKW